MARLMPILLAVPCLAVQEPESLTVEQELAALIEQTNALDSFHLLYDMESEVEGEASQMSMELVYLAPDLGRMRVLGAEGEVDNWMVGERVYVLTDEEWKSAVLTEPPVRVALEEAFPAEEQPLEAGVDLRLTLEREASGAGNFQLTFRNLPAGRTCVLGWLQNLQNWSGVSAEGSSLSWEEDGLRCQVSRETGLLEELDVTSEKGRMRMRLREADVNTVLAPELTEIPRAARAAPVDVELCRALIPGRGQLRFQAFLRVEHQLASGKRSWNGLARNDWRGVLEALHRPALLEGYAEWLARMTERIGENAERARAECDAHDSPEHRAEFERKVAQGRASLEEVLSQGETRYLDGLSALESARDEPRQELFDTEREVVDELWAELLREPLLATYDEEFGELLER